MEVPGSSPQLALNLSQVVGQTNVSNISINPNRQHGCKAYYRQRLTEIENPMLYLLLYRLKSQAPLLQSHRTLVTVQTGTSPGASCRSKPAPAPLPSHAPLLLVPFGTSPSAGDPSHFPRHALVFLADWAYSFLVPMVHISTWPSTWINLQHITVLLRSKMLFPAWHSSGLPESLNIIICGLWPCRLVYTYCSSV